MRNFFLLETAIHYMEEHLCDPMTSEDVAKACCSSLSGLQKLFRYALHYSLKEYISKRRLTKAAWDLVHTDDSVTQIALRFQFNSPEVFSRAFKRLWDVTPSRFRETLRFSGLCPRLDYHFQEGDDMAMARKRVDLSEAYETFQRLEGTCVICFDINRLTPVNALSREAGDKAILAAARRLDEAAEDDMLVIRIGGDEFALLTGSEEIAKAEEVMGRVLAQNGQPFCWNGREIPLSLRGGITRIERNHLRYSELFTQMHHSIPKNQET